MSQELNFDSLELIQIPVTIGHRKYLLEEADGEAGEAYQNAMVAGAKMQDGKLTGLTDVASIQSLLVSKCLWETDPQTGAKTSRVPQKTVRSWPNRVVKGLFDKAMEISDLREKDAEKKPLPGPSATPAGST